MSIPALTYPIQVVVVGWPSLIDGNKIFDGDWLHAICKRRRRRTAKESGRSYAKHAFPIASKLIRKPTSRRFCWAVAICNPAMANCTLKSTPTVLSRPTCVERLLHWKRGNYAWSGILCFEQVEELAWLIQVGGPEPDRSRSNSQWFIDGSEAVDLSRIVILPSENHID